MYHYTWLEHIPGAADFFHSLHLDAYASPILHAWLVCFLIIIGAVLGRMKLNAVMASDNVERFIPDSGLSIRNICELFVGGLHNLIKDVLGEDVRQPIFFSLLAGMFIFILVSNWMGLVPGFAAPTGDINTNVAMALVVLVVFNVAGIMRNGMSYFTHLLGPIWWMAPLMLVVESLGVFVVRPVSLSLRLTGNMFGDHLVFGIMSDLIPLVVPCIFLGLGAFVSFIQALVSTLLSAVYIALATAHEDEH